MNIDKFGHHVHKRLRLSDLFDFTENALIKKENGHYDLQSSRLKGLQTPQDLNDAVNKEYIDEIVKKMCTREEVKFLVNEVTKEAQRVINLFINDVYTRREVDLKLKSLVKDEGTSGKRNS